VVVADSLACPDLVEDHERGSLQTTPHHLGPERAALPFLVPLEAALLGLYQIFGQTIGGEVFRAANHIRDTQRRARFASAWLTEQHERPRGFACGGRLQDRTERFIDGSQVPPLGRQTFDLRLLEAELRPGSFWRCRRICQALHGLG
jgi:hypothetical protein